jgi:hypothetical protein
MSSGLPFGVPTTLRLSISPLEQTSAARMDPQVVTTIAGVPSMFRTLGVEILRGRGFGDRDGPAAPRVVVLSEFTARQLCKVGQDWREIPGLRSEITNGRDLTYIIEASSTRDVRCGSEPRATWV